MMDFLYRPYGAPKVVGFRTCSFPTNHSVHVHAHVLLNGRSVIQNAYRRRYVPILVVFLASVRNMETFLSVTDAEINFKQLQL